MTNDEQQYNKHMRKLLIEVMGALKAYLQENRPDNFNVLQARDLLKEKGFIEDIDSAFNVGMLMHKLKTSAEQLHKKTTSVPKARRFEV